MSDAEPDEDPEADPDEDPESQNRSNWLGERSVAFWTVAGGIIAFVGLVVTLFSAFAGANGQEKSDLELVGLTVGRKISVGAEAPTPNPGSSNSPQSPESLVDYQASIDITLRNNGDSSSLINGIAVVFNSATVISPCLYPPPTGGPIEIDAEYTVTVPAEFDSFPATVENEVRFATDAHALARFTISIGRDGGQFYGTPWLYDMNIYLLHDKERLLSIGRVSVLTAENYAWLPPSDDCLTDIEKALADASSSGVVASPGVASALHDARLVISAVECGPTDNYTLFRSANVTCEEAFAIVRKLSSHDEEKYISGWHCINRLDGFTCDGRDDASRIFLS